MAKLKLKLYNYNEILAKCQDDKFYAEPWKRAFTEVVNLVEQKAKKRAPGTLGSKITKRMDTGPLPLWGIISTNAKSASGFRYPFVLESGHRARGNRRTALGIGGVHLRRRRGKFGEMVTYQTKSGKTRRKFQIDQDAYIDLHYAGKKKSTRRWLRGSLGGVAKQAKTLMDAAAKQIESNWQVT